MNEIEILFLLILIFVGIATTVFLAYLAMNARTLDDRQDIEKGGCHGRKDDKQIYKEP